MGSKSDKSNNDWLFCINKAMRTVKGVAISAPLAISTTLTTPLTLTSISAAVTSLGLSGCGGGDMNETDDPSEAIPVTQMRYPGTLHWTDTIITNVGAVSVGRTPMTNEENLPTSLSNSNLIRFSPDRTPYNPNNAYFDIRTGNIYLYQTYKVSSPYLINFSYSPNGLYEYLGYKSTLNNLISNIYKVYNNCQQIDKHRVEEIIKYLESYSANMRQTPIANLHYQGILYKLALMNSTNATIQIDETNLFISDDNSLPSATDQIHLKTSKDFNEHYQPGQPSLLGLLYLGLNSGNIFEYTTNDTGSNWEVIPPNETERYKERLAVIAQRVASMNGIQTTQNDDLETLVHYLESIMALYP